MFREVYMQPFSYIRQSPIGGIEKHVRSYIILWSNPLTFENTPKSLRNVQLWRIWRQKKEEKPSPFPYGTEFLYLLVPMYRGIVKDDKCIRFQIERHFIKETYHLVGCHLLKCSKTFIAVVTVYHSKDIETCNSLGRNINILPSQLPAVRDISFCTSMAFVSIIEPYASFRRLLFKFLLIRLYLAPMLIKNV